LPKAERLISAAASFLIISLSLSEKGIFLANISSRLPALALLSGPQCARLLADYDRLLRTLKKIAAISDVQGKMLKQRENGSSKTLLDPRRV